MKQRIAYADLAWAAAFACIEEGQHLWADGSLYTILWKHFDPDWIQLGYRMNKKLVRRIVRKGDPLLLELRHE